MHIHEQRRINRLYSLRRSNVYRTLAEVLNNDINRLQRHAIFVSHVTQYVRLLRCQGRLVYVNRNQLFKSHTEHASSNKFWTMETVSAILNVNISNSTKSNDSFFFFFFK